VSKLLIEEGDNHGLTFWCPGCDGAHRVQHGNGPGARWEWNGSLDKPTFKPSIFVNARQSNPMVPSCHSFVTDGRIQFLNDCTHALAGQTVDLPEWD
jgi:hypothetical protein